MKRRVVITGMGAITPVGLSAKETWTNVRNGVVGIAPIETLDTEERQVKVAGEVKGFDPTEIMDKMEARRSARFTQFAIQAALDGATAAVYVQSPNYYGVLEDMDAIVAATHAAGAKVIMGVNPISLGLLKTPGEYGVDIAVGEGQPLGMPLSFGGPYLGFMTCKKAMMRKLPGRIVGETKDDDGNRCFVLTLQAREQHIRREKASSNICSNEALCAMTASVYLAAMGPKGLRQAAESSAAHAHYLAGELAKLGFGLRSGDKPFFHEFLTDSPIEPETLCAKLEEQGILGGLPVDGGILWCCTECNSKAEIDRLIKVIGEVLA